MLITYIIASPAPPNNGVGVVVRVTQSTSKSASIKDKSSTESEFLVSFDSV